MIFRFLIPILSSLFFSSAARHAGSRGRKKLWWEKPAALLRGVGSLESKGLLVEAQARRRLCDTRQNAEGDERV